MSPSEQIIEALMDYEGSDFVVNDALLEFISDVFKIRSSVPTCDHDYHPIREYHQTGNFICVKCKHKI